MSDQLIQPIVCPNLYTERLLLRPFEAADAMALIGWACDPEETKYLRFHVHESISDSKRVISKWIDDQRNPPNFHWAVTLRSTGKVFGSIGIAVVNATDRFGEIGYCIAKQMWNQGYTTEALRRVLEFGFEDANFNRIQGNHSVNNMASGRVMEKAGMHREAGPLRDWYKSDILGVQDCYMWVAFADTWQID